MKIALIGSNKPAAETMVAWSKGEGYEVNCFDKLDSSAVQPEEIDVLLVDIYSLEILDLSRDREELSAGIFGSLVRLLKSDPPLSDLHLILLVSEKVETGADDFAAKFSEKQFFLEEVAKITAKLRPDQAKRRLLDLNLINFFLKLLPSASREEFFLLAPVIFNAAVIRRVMPYVGENTIAVIIHRLRESMGKQEEFMKGIKFEHGQILMDEVDKNSKEVSVSLLCSALRNYIYGFVHLVQVLTSDILIERWDRER